jgi:hypothetical protein
MALLDLQGMEETTRELSDGWGGGDGSDASLLLCRHTSSLSLIECV